MLKIAIITRSENGSSKVLGQTLQKLMEEIGHDAEILYEANAVQRLLSYKKVKHNKLLWLLYKTKNLVRDNRLFSHLKEKDAIIICDCTPLAFFNYVYDIDKLKLKAAGIPILYYAVQYLKNSPTIIERLISGNHYNADIFDWHLAVSDATEIRSLPSPPWSQIGMYLKSTGLKPEIKKEFVALVDFVQPGYEHYREAQIKVLTEMNIPFISLEKRYSVSEIREFYKKASLYFIQFPEAFGLPIAECLSCGSYVVTPKSSWAMSWRLDDKLEVHGGGRLPDCFIVYKDEKDLKDQISIIRDSYHLEETPKEVFRSFYKNYPSFYEGNTKALKEVLLKIERKEIK